MSLSLFQASALNTSAGPVAYPPLQPPDLYNCADYYATPAPPLASDCRTAFGLLPTGQQPMIWYTEPAAGERRNVLPLQIHHGQQPCLPATLPPLLTPKSWSGTCEITFHTSGQSADTVDHFSIVPDDIKTMASWVLGRCSSSGRGGMATKGLRKTLDPMVDINARWLPAPLPASSSFYSLHIWNYIGTDIDWNPGNSDPDVGGAIDAALKNAMAATPARSPQRAELVRREEWLWGAVHRMEYGEPTTNWWDGPRPRGLVSASNDSCSSSSSSRDCHGGSATA